MEPVFRTGEPDRWLHFITFGVAAIIAAALFSAAFIQRDTTNAGATEHRNAAIELNIVTGDVEPAADDDGSTPQELPTMTAAPAPTSTAAPEPDQIAAPLPPASADGSAPTTTPPTPVEAQPAGEAADDAPATTAPTTTAAPSPTPTPTPTPTTEPEIVTVAAPAPPSVRFVAGDVASLLNSAGGADPVAGALELLRRSGPLAAGLADEPLVAERLTDALDGAQLFGQRDYADRVLAALNSALDTLASDWAVAGTGLCLVVGPDQCIQVPDLNHTFSAMPHRSRVDAVVDAYGNDAAATQIARIADLHFTGNAWAILREAHHVALTAELRHAWINAGVSLELATAETTAHLAFLRAYMDAARDERVETWKIMTGDGTGTGVATTWNMLVAAFATDDDAYWNIAFLPDSSSIVELTDGAAGSTRAPL